MTKTEILERLRNDEDYYGDFGKQFLSNSNIDALTSEPRQFQAPQKDGEPFVKGRYFHQLILEPEKAKSFPIVDASSRSTKVYKEFIEQNNMDYALLTKDASNIEDMVSHTISNLKFFELINDPSAKYEVPAIGEIMGVQWKGKADILTDNYIIDIKSSGDVFKFNRNALYYNYHTQAYIYQALFGKPVVFLVTGKIKKYDRNNKPYYDLGIFTMSQESMALAEEKVAQAVTSYNKWFSDLDSQDNIEDYIINSTI